MRTQTLEDSSDAFNSQTKHESQLQLQASLNRENLGLQLNQLSQCNSRAQFEHK